MNCFARIVVSCFVAVFLAVIPLFSALSSPVFAEQAVAPGIHSESVANHHAAMDVGDGATEHDSGGHHESSSDGNCCVSACHPANVQPCHDFDIQLAAPGYELVEPADLGTVAPLGLERPPKQA